MSRVFSLQKRWWLGLPFLYIAAVFFAHGFFYEPPILMYHHVEMAPEEDDSTFVSPENFERQMEFLKVHRYRVLGLSDLLREIKKNGQVPAKTVSITFDDGNLNNFRNAFPVLKKMGFPATIFMITDNIGRPDWLSEEDLRILDEANIAIGSHTVHHTYLPEVSLTEVEAELKDSKARLEEVLGHPVTLFSYPAGGMTPEIQKLVEAAGYECAVTTNYGKRNRDPFGLRRIKVKDSAGNLFNFWAKTSGYYRLGKRHVQYH